MLVIGFERDFEEISLKLETEGRGLVTEIKFSMTAKRSAVNFGGVINEKSNTGFKSWNDSDI